MVFEPLSCSLLHGVIAIRAYMCTLKPLAFTGELVRYIQVNISYITATYSVALLLLSEVRTSLQAFPAFQLFEKGQATPFINHDIFRETTV
jgi:hypothetical protein